MIVTVFRSRHRPGIESEYKEWAKRMGDIAVTMPGYISHKGFVAEDGEFLTLVEFESEEAQRAWGTHPEHVRAQKHGRARFYSEYRVQITNVIRDWGFKQDAES